MTASASSFSIQIPNPDGSVTNLSGEITIASLTTTPPPVIQPPPPPPPPPPPVTLEPTIPATANVVDMLAFPFACNHDAGTPGDARGTSTYPVTAPDGTPNCRLFDFTLDAKGGIIYHGNVLKDSSAYNTFCYEVAEYFVDPSNLQCHEKDLEQVGPDGVYVDMATQLNGNAGFLDYTENQGWKHSAVKADPTGIPAGTWHVTKRYFKNLGGGMVEYTGSNDGGAYSPLGITVKSQPSKKWGKNILNVQYQFDGKSSGSVRSTVYVRVFRIHCWKS